MANLLTHALIFKAEDISKFFVDPTFTGTDVMDIVDVFTDVRGTLNLNKISRPSKVTHASSVGFTASGSMTLTNPTLVVVPLKAEFEENGEALTNSILQELAAKGVAYDDIAEASNDLVYQLMLQVVSDVVKKDKNRQMWFGDTVHETLTGTTPNANPTGTLDADFTPYNGFWTKLFTDVGAGTIPSAQRVTISSVSHVAKIATWTLSAFTAGTTSLTVNGVAYTEAFDTSIDKTVDNWIASHEATIEARAGLNAVTLAKGGSGAIVFTAKYPGQGFTIADSGTGTWTESAVTAAVTESALGTDQAEAVLEDMIDAMPVEMQGMESDAVFMVTRTFWRNYVATLKNTGNDLGQSTIINGQKVYTYEGIPVIVMPQWDEVIANDYNSIYKHRALLTVKKNLIFGTDGAQDDGAIDTWYNKDLEMRRFRVKYRAGVTYKHKELIVVAY